MSKPTFERNISASSLPPTISEEPFSRNFSDKNNAAARAIYLKTLVGGCFFIIIAIFALFPIFWGALWKSPVRNLDGWVVDFDGGLIGQKVVHALTSPELSSLGKITWTVVPASRFPNGLGELGNAVVDEQTWAAIAIHEGATTRLQASYTSPNAAYNGTEAITLYAAEARNENAYRSLIRPSAEATLNIISQTFALQSVGQIISSNLTALLATSPQTVLTPISYTIHNLVPFDIPVASAVTFVGLIYQLIIAFFVVMIGLTARETSGFNQQLSLRSLIITRLVSSFVAYFVLSLFYALLSLAFKLEFDRKFGQGGFVVFWMLNWIGMLSVGLAIDALITLLTTKFIPFFMILWIIANVSVCILPIEVLPVVFRFGYAAPFYNVSHAVRCIIFGTKNTVGVNFAVLITWTMISCISLPLIQWFVRRQDIAVARGAKEVEMIPRSEDKEISA